MDNTLSSDNQVTKNIKSLYHVATILHNKRKEKGVFSQMRETLEFEVEDGDYQNVSSITAACKKSASIIVKEFLLLANTSVAQKIAMHFPDQALLRRHSPPDPRKIVSIFIQTLYLLLMY